ncbi:MAG: PIG-L family deacetylase, partial [Vicinamibacterales bacterium]
AALKRQRLDPDVEFVLSAKERQIAEAMHAALGIHVSATAQPAGSPESTGPFGAARPAMPPVVPGQTFEVRATFTNRSRTDVGLAGLSLESTDRATRWTIAPTVNEGGSGTSSPAAPFNEPVVEKFTVTVPENATLSRPLFSRASLAESRYSVADERQRYRASAEGPLELVARYDVDGVPVEIRRPVTRLEANLPYGYDTRVLAVVPALSVTMSPVHAVVALRHAPGNAADTRITLKVEVLNNREQGSDGALTLKLPAGWKVTPVSQPFRFSGAGERALYSFEVAIPSLEDREYRIEAVAVAGGREYRQGYATIRHRDLETRYLYRDAVTSVRGVDVTIAPGLSVGYVMGVGDDVPAHLAQLGVKVQLLGERDLASADLGGLDAIVTGTRAYAVRDDLKTYNRRLLDYVKAGGNLIVLYNTPELVPGQYAPYPGTLSARAEEVSEEDSPVEIVAPGHQVLTWPNRITKSDFEGWVEQRGSKFWDAWDREYTPLIATWDTGQRPQKGGWLHARYGDGHYTYFAYAVHRQLPYGVPGAYRLLANLLSLNQKAPPSR